jgi:hypothetical protein
MAGGKIFLSYRRDDTAGHAGRMYDRLNARFPGRVFMDVVGLEPGTDFVSEIEAAVGSCQVLIALIGKQWLTITDQAGRRRLDRADDFVKLEIATALRRDIRVVPVLVGDAVFPPAESLPKHLAPLSRRHALKITDTNFDHDVERLIRTLERELGKSGDTFGQRALRSARTFHLRKRPALFVSTRNLRRAVIAGGLLSGAVVIGLRYAGSEWQKSVSDTTDEAAGFSDTAQMHTVDIKLDDGGEAFVYRDGEQVGRTPFKLRGLRDQWVELVLKRSHFKDKPLKIQISGRREYNVGMEPEE